MLARAGPLALAFDLQSRHLRVSLPEDLTTPQEIADWIATTTSIGEDGSYLKELTTKGRFQTFPLLQQGIPSPAGGGGAHHLQRRGQEEEERGRGGRDGEAGAERLSGLRHRSEGRAKGGIGWRRTI